MAGVVAVVAVAGIVEVAVVVNQYWTAKLAVRCMGSFNPGITLPENLRSTYRYNLVRCGSRSAALSFDFCFCDLRAAGRQIDAASTMSGNLSFPSGHAVCHACMMDDGIAHANAGAAVARGIRDP